MERKLSRQNPAYYDITIRDLNGLKSQDEVLYFRETAHNVAKEMFSRLDRKSPDFATTVAAYFDDMVRANKRSSLTQPSDSFNRQNDSFNRPRSEDTGQFISPQINDTRPEVQPEPRRVVTPYGNYTVGDLINGKK